MSSLAAELSRAAPLRTGSNTESSLHLRVPAPAPGPVHTHERDGWWAMAPQVVAHAPKGPPAVTIGDAK